MIRKIAILVSIATMFSSILSFKIEQPFEALSIDERAALCGLEPAEFQLFSGIVEAESNRSTDGDLSGRIMIALTIWNRINDDRWPSTAEGVLTQRGQFSTVRNGHSVTNRTEWSDRAVYEAYIWLNEDDSDAPDVQFFNCRGYFSGVEPCAYVGGNYFSYGY